MATSKEDKVPGKGKKISNEYETSSQGTMTNEPGFTTVIGEKTQKERKRLVQCAGSEAQQQASSSASLLIDSAAAIGQQASHSFPLIDSATTIGQRVSHSSHLTDSATAIGQRAPASSSVSSQSEVSPKDEDSLEQLTAAFSEASKEGFSDEYGFSLKTQLAMFNLSRECARRLGESEANVESLKTIITEKNDEASRTADKLKKRARRILELVEKNESLETRNKALYADKESLEIHNEDLKGLYIRACATSEKLQNLLENSQSTKAEALQDTVEALKRSMSLLDENQALRRQIDATRHVTAARGTGIFGDPAVSVTPGSSHGGELMSTSTHGTTKTSSPQTSWSNHQGLLPAHNPFGRRSAPPSGLAPANASDEQRDSDSEEEGGKSRKRERKAP